MRFVAGHLLAMGQIAHIADLGITFAPLADWNLGTVLEDEFFLVHQAHIIHIEDDAVMTFEKAIVLQEDFGAVGIGQQGIHIRLGQM